MTRRPSWNRAPFRAVSTAITNKAASSHACLCPTNYPKDKQHNARTIFGRPLETMDYKTAHFALPALLPEVPTGIHTSPGSFPVNLTKTQPHLQVTTPPAGNMSSSREDKSQGTDKEQVKDRHMERFKDAKDKMERNSGGGGNGGKGKNKETTTVNYTCFCPWCCSNSVTTYKTCDSCRAKGARRGHTRYVFPSLF